MSKVLLGLNIDHIATLRNTRNTKYPDPLYAVSIAEHAGVNSITVHLREDRRHIIDQDVILIRQIIQTNMNLEIAATDEMVDFACKLKPHFCCLVPEKRAELTTEKGLDVINQIDKLQNIVSKLTSFGIRVSLFIDPNVKQIDAAYTTGASCIELNTGLYVSAFASKSNEILEYNRIKNSIEYATKYGFIINAGHGLNYYNVQKIAILPQINELNIGHSIISRSVFCGLFSAIEDMQKLLQESRRG